MKPSWTIVLIFIFSHFIISAQHVEIEQDLESFDRIVFNGNYEVSLHQGEREGIVLEGNEANLVAIEVSHWSGEVTVGPSHKDEWKAMKKVYVKIYFKELSKMVFNGISRVRSSTPLIGESLTIQCNGIRNLHLHLLLDELIAEFNGTGRTYLHGSAEYARINYSGIGQLKAFNLKTENLSIHSAGIGRIEVCALKSLNVEALGIGSVHYVGNPEVRRLDANGIGKIHAVHL